MKNMLGRIERLSVIKRNEHWPAHFGFQRLRKVPDIRETAVDVLGECLLCPCTRCTSILAHSAHVQRIRRACDDEAVVGERVDEECRVEGHKGQPRVACALYDIIGSPYGAELANMLDSGGV